MQMIHLVPEAQYAKVLLEASKVAKLFAGHSVVVVEVHFPYLLPVAASFK